MSIGHLSVPECPTPPELETANMAELTTPLEVGSEATYICLDGFRFLGGAVQHTLTCIVDPNDEQTGMWQDIEECTGK